MDKFLQKLKHLENLIQNKEILTNLNNLKQISLEADFFKREDFVDIQKKITFLEKIKKTFQEYQNTIKNFQELGEIFNKEEKENIFLELEKKEEILEKLLIFDGKYDQNSAYLIFSVGAGGVDASDFSEILMQMYLKYAEKNNWDTEILALVKADIAGIKSATILVKGEDFIYGLLKKEAGMHRLVRKSPFNSGHTRETSFCHLDVIPEINSKNYEILEKDLKIESFKAQGAGGQHVNTTDSAVRITHLKSGITAQCQNQRSQHKNKETALKILKSRLLKQQEEEEKAKQEKLKTQKTNASFGGGHIRSYVMDDKYVKDHRSNFKNSKISEILNGDLDELIWSNFKD
jgi:peptide chain release factor 2